MKQDLNDKLVVCCVVTISDWKRGDNKKYYPYINNVSQMYWPLTFNSYSIMPINFDTLNRVLVKSVINAVSINK